MKKLAFFILLSLVTLGVSAQSNLKWNVNAGIGMSNWYGDDTDGTDAKFAYKVGIGLEVPFANTNIWSFQTGLNFISKGVKGDGVTDAWDVVDVTINQLYLELPLMVGARIHTASNFDLLFKGGPYLAYGVGGKTKIDGVSEKADTFGDDGLKRFDAGLGLGVAFEFGNIVVGVETGTSFTKVASGVLVLITFLHWPLLVINSDHRYNLTFKYIKNGCFSFRKKQPFFLDEAWFMK
jgi:hypothetical protein